MLFEYFDRNYVVRRDILCNLQNKIETVNWCITEVYELRNTDITEFTCLDFSNVNLKFLILRSLKSKLQSCQNEKKCQKESMGKICLVLVSKRIHSKKYQVSKRFFIRNKFI